MTIRADESEIIGKKGVRTATNLFESTVIQVFAVIQPKGIACYKSEKALLVGEYEGKSM